MAVNSVRRGFLCNNSGLPILLLGVMSLPDATSCDNTHCTLICPDKKNLMEQTRQPNKDKHETFNTKSTHKRSSALERSVKIILEGLNMFNGTKAHS